MWFEWWAWGAAAIVLAIGEVLLPSFVLLGFGIGAGLIALVLLVGGPLAVMIAGTVPAMLLTFAIMSLIAWLVLRRLVGVQRGQVKTFDSDINDD